MLIMTEGFWHDVLTDETDHAVAGPFTGRLDALDVMLFTNLAVLSGLSVIGDLTEATFTGYARKVNSWGAPWQRPDRGFVISGSLAQWQMTDTVTPEVIYGYALVTHGGTPKLVGAELFATPIALNTTLDAVIVVPQVVLGGVDNGSAFVQGP